MVITYILLGLIFIFIILIIVRHTVLVNSSKLTKTKLHRAMNTTTLLLDVILYTTADHIILKLFWIFMICVFIVFDISYGQIIYEEKLKIWEKYNEENNRRNNNM